VILGIGNDLCNITRIEGVLSRYGDRFLSHVMSEDEQRQVKERPQAAQASMIAKRFAAKEACAKALGTGIAEGVYLRDLRIENAANGKPSLGIYGGALERLKSLTPKGMVARVDVSLSDDYPMAMAMVVISAIPGA
jgi:holo-[acyl-carrier protein] synthase